MEKRDNLLGVEIENISKEFLKIPSEKEIQVIAHCDTDGITAATLMIKTLKGLDKKFTLKITKNLDEEFIRRLTLNKVTLFLDLASENLDQLKETGTSDIYIIDHKKIIQNIPDNIKIINPELHDNQQLSSSYLTYLFCKEIYPEINEFAKLGILGMIGDALDNEISQLGKEFLIEGEIKQKRGLKIYPSTRPLNRTLEYSSKPYIPNVTGEVKGVLELLREVGLNPKNGKYKTLLELNEDEMEKLLTAILLRNPKSKSEEIVGDIFLLKMFNKAEDAREISSMINACSKLGKPEIAIQMCLEIPKAKKEAEAMHVQYKQFIISGLKFIKETEKISGNGYVIINAKENIKDAMIGTIANILTNSSLYEEGTIITTMVYQKDKIKIFSRAVGDSGRNARTMLNTVVGQLGEKAKGDNFAARCIISKEKEEEFIDLMKKNLEIEVIKVQSE